MCGIAGVIDPSGAPVDPDLVRRMTRAIGEMTVSPAPEWFFFFVVMRTLIYNRQRKPA